MIDLWTDVPTIVAQVQGCFDARSVEGSKFEGYEDQYIIEGCYWPPQYVVFDGLTLEPLVIHDVLSPDINGKELDEVRVAAIVASHFDPVWVMGLKESGYVAIVDYSQPDFPLVKKIPADLFLHDGGWDHTGRYFITAANAQNKLMVVDVKTQELVAGVETGETPHPGRGANWVDPEFGWVYATTHIGEGKLTLIGADPEQNPEHTWKVVREVELPGTGSLFLKTHPNSPWVCIGHTAVQRPRRGPASLRVQQGIHATRDVFRDAPTTGVSSIFSTTRLATRSGYRCGIRRANS